MAFQTWSVVLLAAGVACASSCKPVRDSSPVYLTTDSTLHTVELRTFDELTYSYSIQFPQAFYTYEDDHFKREQPSVGLLLEKASFRAWTQVVSSETGVVAPLSSGGNRLSQAALRAGNYDARLLWVDIKAVDPRRVLRRDNRQTAALSGEVWVNDWHGFRVLTDKKPFKPTLPRIFGWTKSGPLVSVSCLEGVKNCSFRRQFGPSEVTFMLRRDQASEASALSSRLLLLLQQRLVPRGTEP